MTLFREQGSQSNLQGEIVGYFYIRILVVANTNLGLQQEWEMKAWEK